MITSSQIRAGRALLGMTVKDLAVQAKIGFSTLVRIESFDNEVPVANIRTIEAVKRTLEEAGIEFIGTPESGAGVKWKV